MPTAHALSANVEYPIGLCQANLAEATTAPNEPSRGTIAISLGGAPATADECFDDAYTNSGVAVTTGSSASSSIAAIALNSCYSIGDYLSAVGGGVAQCSRGFLANVSVFSDAYGGLPGSLVSFSLLGNASGSYLAIAPFGSASGQVAVGCTAAYGSADVWWRWCSAWEPALTPSQRQLVYDSLQGLASLGLVETQAALNFYHGLMESTGDISQTLTVENPLLPAAASLSVTASLRPVGLTVPVAQAERPLCTMEIRGHFSGTRQDGHVISGAWAYGASTTCTPYTPAFEYIEVSAKLSHDSEGVVSQTPTNYCDDCFERSTDTQFFGCADGAGGGCSGHWFATSQHTTYAPPGYVWDSSSDTRCTVQLNGKELYCLLQGQADIP